ncbi:MAG: aminotransferase class V-fold PLP-dependent enzyme [Actinomycetes bacterium]
MVRGFLDAASGQPLHPFALRAAAGFAARVWADPSMPHHEGRAARQVLDAARATVAEVIGIEPGAVSFQRAGRSVAELAIRGLAQGPTDTGLLPPTRIHTSAVDRSVVLDASREVAGSAGVSIVGVDPTGKINTDAFEASLLSSPPDERRLAAIQAANIELGTLQPLARLLHIAADQGVPVAVDGTGALGWIDIEKGWSALFADATSFAGPRGAAVLALAPTARWRLPGSDGVESQPPRSDDVASAVTTATALDAVHRDRFRESARLSELIERIRARVVETIPDVELLGDAQDRLPNTVTFSCLYADGERLALELDRLGFAVGSGSACASRTGLPSHVLTAIGSLTHGNVRVSLPVGCPAEAIDRFLAALPGAVALVRSEAGAP